MNIIGHLTSCFQWMVNGLCGVMGGGFSFLVTIEKVLCQFLLKIRVMTCVDLRPVFLINRVKRTFGFRLKPTRQNLNCKKDQRAWKYSLNDK